MSIFFERDDGAGSSGGGTIPGAFIRTGVLSVTLPAGQTDDFTDAALGSVSVVLISTNAAGSSLSGIVPPANGTQLSINNQGPVGDLTLLNVTGSAAANQFSFLLLGDFILPAGSAVDIWYNSITSKWILI